MTVALVALLAIGAVACGNDEPENPFPNSGSLPGNTGSTCADRAGDLSKDARTLGGNLSEPKGADIVKAEARLTETTLTVAMTMAGPVAGTPTPEFILAQGLPSEETAFELRAAPGADGAAPWSLRLVRFRKDAKGAVAQVRPDTVLAVPVKIDGPTLSYEVPLKDLPRVSSYVWQFGSSSGATDTIIDVCDGGDPTASTVAPPVTEAPATTAPAGLTEGKVGDTLTFNTGTTIKVHKVESPPESPRAGTSPAEPGEKLVAADVEVCAPAGAEATSSRSFFFVKDNANRVRPTAELAVPPHEPVLPPSLTLKAGACQRAWVTFQISADSEPDLIVYGTEQSAANALTWTIG